MHPLAGAYWLTSLSPREEGQSRVCRDRVRPVYNIVDLFFVQVGQMQLIRRQISNELNCSCKFDSQVLYNALGTFNK